MKILQRVLLIIVIVLSIYDILCQTNVIPREYSINIVYILSILMVALVLNHRKHD